jgi:nucleoside-diphosphate-sugar epimerase
MRIFLTGGTGHIGSAALDALVRAGHRVDVLVRSSERAAQVQARGAHPVLGDLSKPVSYADAIAGADGAIHTAYDYSAKGPDIDAMVVDALLNQPRRPGAFVIYTSGVWVLGDCPAPADESAPVNPARHVAWRAGHEERVLAAASPDLRVVVVRPGIVYGGSRGLVAEFIKSAADGLVRVIGSGDNHWPLVYDRDLGELYARLAASGDASGIFHANDEGDERVNDLVAAFATQVKTAPSVRHVPLAEARRKLGPVAEALALDQVVRSPRARALGWHPSLHSVAGNAARLFEEWRRGRDAA